MWCIEKLIEEKATEIRRYCQNERLQITNYRIQCETSSASIIACGDRVEWRATVKLIVKGSYTEEARYRQPRDRHKIQIVIRGSRHTRRRARWSTTTATKFDVAEDDEERRALRAAAGRCSPLGVSTSICGSRWPRTGLLSPVSPNQKTGSVSLDDWSGTATVKTAIGQPARVTHGYRLHQQHLGSILQRLAIPNPVYVLLHVQRSRTQAAINTYITPGRGRNSRGQPLFFHHRSPLSLYERSLPLRDQPPASRKLKTIATVG